MTSGLQHAGEVLDLFTLETPEWGPTGVARELSVSKSHAHRLLSSLVEIGLLERRPATRRYRLGRRALALSAVLLESDELLSRALAAIDVLQQHTSTDVALNLTDSRVILQLRHGRQPFVLPCADADCAALTAVLNAEPAVRGAAGSLFSRLRYVRAGVVEIRTEAGFGAAVPILDASGAVVAALSLQTTVTRWTSDRQALLGQLQSAAVRLTAGALADAPCPAPVGQLGALGSP